MILTLRAEEDDGGRRLDRILRKALPNLPFSALYRYLRKGEVKVDGKRARVSHRVQSGQIITIEGFPEEYSSRSSAAPPQKQGPLPGPSEAAPELVPLGDLPPLDILYQGEGLLILNKPVGLMVHRDKSGAPTLDDQVQAYLGPSTSLSFKSGPLHRLDWSSSGITVFSTTLKGAKEFSALMREGMIEKYYLAIVEGTIKEESFWDDELYRDKENKRSGSPPPGTQGQAARSIVSPLAAAGGYSLIQVKIETGRTHQIRAQGCLHGHPLAGDKRYGGAPLPKIGEKTPLGFCLHAWEMMIPMEAGAIRVQAPLPEGFREMMGGIFGNEGKLIGEIKRL
ncbi:MAG: RluA family pseudouridine synthase [Treponema sp.]|nr:RluA family pseudouridine synthase [Treponema sp.]